MMNQRTVEASGAPLAVCLNDCQIDCGQEASELALVCFKVGCAFAEMRWGSLINASRARTSSSPPAASETLIQITVAA
jgi:hypothetical protein